MDKKSRGWRTVVLVALATLIGCAAPTALDRQLLAAAGEGNLEQVRTCLSQGANVNAKDPGDPDSPESQGFTALHLAAQQGKKDLVEFLLEKGVKVNARDRLGRTPLIFAAGTGDTELAGVLLAHGADVNAGTGWVGGSYLAYEGEFPASTPLFAALAHGRKEMVRYLLEHGAHPDPRDARGRGPVHWMAECGEVEMARAFLDAGAKVNVADKSGLTPLHLAAEQGSVDMVELLLAKGAKVDARAGFVERMVEAFPRFTPLFAAAHEDHADVAKVLLERGADANTATPEGVTALHVAVDRGSADVVRVLLDSGADVNARTKTGFTFSRLFNKSNDALEVAKGVTPLHLAAKGGSKEAAELLLARGADINAKDKDGRTPADYAGSNPNYEVTKLLLPRGNVFSAAAAGKQEEVAALLEANPDLVNARGEVLGQSPLFMAASAGQLEVVKLLRTKGADVNAKTNVGWTALHMAVKMQPETVQLLIANGADVNARDVTGRTPLHFLSSERVGDSSVLLRLMELLIANGADVNAADNRGWTPLHAAVFGGARDRVQLLLDSGADVNAETVKNRIDSREHVTPLHIAVHDGRGDIAALLLAKGATLDIFTACGLGRVEEVTELLQAEPGLVHARIGVDRWATPLEWAVALGQKEVTEALLSSGADANLSVTGWTPLQQAAWSGQEDLVDLLLAHGAKVNAKTDEGYGGGNPWASHEPGDTALHMAAREGHEGVVALLLANGAKVNARNSAGQTPLAEALRANQAGVADLLRQHGGRK